MQPTIEFVLLTGFSGPEILFEMKEKHSTEIQLWVHSYNPPFEPSKSESTMT